MKENEEKKAALEDEQLDCVSGGDHGSFGHIELMSRISHDREPVRRIETTEQFQLSHGR